MGSIADIESEGGFSLVELTIVIVIIGILVSIAAVSYAISVSTSRQTVCRANLRVIEEQVLVYRSVNEAFPAVLSGLVPEFIDNERCLRCPETGEGYAYDPTTGRVSCPHHGGD